MEFNNISRKKYVHYDSMTGKILGFYNKIENYTIPEPYIEVDEVFYNLYFESINIGKEYRVVDGELDVNFIRDNISLEDYKALKNAKIMYEARKRTSMPFEYQGNFYDVYFLRSNYFDQRFLEEISKKTTNDIKLSTINNRMITMTVETFMDFYYSYTQYMKTINDKQLELMDRIFDADDKETIDDVIWEDDINNIVYPKDSIFMPITDTSNAYSNSIHAKDVIESDAPYDNNIYARKNTEWINISTMINDESTLPPIDNKLYVMQNGKWVALANLEVTYK